MTVSSLSSQTMSAPALLGLDSAVRQITSSTYRLSTGDRFYRASDDIAAMSIATRLRSDVSSYRQALQNNTQADSLLQTAYTNLSSISSILDDMKVLATTGNSGGLTAADYAALDLEFQTLRSEIDRIATGTQFNGMNLLDGTISRENEVATATNNATQATGAITFTVNPGAGQTINVNGLSVVAGTDFAIGGTTNITASNFASFLSTSTDTRVSSASYQAVGSTVNITAKAGGRLGEQFVINEAASTAAASFVVTGQTTAVANVFALQGGLNNGLRLGGTTIAGTVGDSLVNTLSQTQASQTLTITANATINNNQTFTIDDGTGAGTINFRFRTATIATAEDFLVGADAETTLQNAVNTITNYATANDFVLNQLEYEISGDNELIIRGQIPGTILDQTGANGAVNETATGVVISGTSLNNGTNTGINTSGVVNPDFVGTISGFSATYNSANNLTASVTVGSSTYTAQITNTAPGANTFYRFNSTNGGYFDVQISAAGAAVTNQADANSFANRLDAAFAPLNVYQSRQVSNFTGVGQLAGATAEIRLNNFSQNLNINDIRVSESTGVGINASVEIEINGEIFRNATLGRSIGANETVTLTSLNDVNNVIRIRNGSTAIDLSSAANAATFEATLNTNFGLGDGDSSISFQFGTTPDDKIDISIRSATSNSLFDDASPALTDQAASAAAQTVLDDAIDELGAIIASVGSSQAVVGFAYDAISNNITTTEAARSALADTDIASEATIFAGAIVQQQAAIAVLAQTQLLGNNLLDLLRPN